MLVKSLTVSEKWELKKLSLNLLSFGTSFANKKPLKNKTMAVDLRCPNCQDNLGKDTENPKKAYCGNCGEEDIKNPRGYDDEEETE